MQNRHLKNRVFARSPHDMALCLFLVLAILFIFWPVKDYDFVRYDDSIYITENVHARTGLSLENIRWAFTSAHAANWHPITWLSHMLDCQIFGMDPGMHHLMSLFFHTLNSLLVYFVFKRMSGNRWKSGFVAAMFAVHPLHVESVAWVAERKDVLCAFFWMLTTWGYLRYVERPGWGRYVLMMLFYILGLMSKPMIVTLPFVLLLLDFWPLCRLGTEAKSPKPSVRRLVVEKSPLMFLAAVSCLVTVIVQQKAGAVGDLEVFPLGLRSANALVAYAVYLIKMIWPSDLAFLYPYPENIPILQVAGAGFLLVAISCLAVLTRRRHPYVLFGWLWYVGTLVPVIGIVQIGSQARADRYTYIPLIGIWVALAWGIPVLLSKYRIPRQVLPIVSFMLFILFIGAARLQVGYWKDSVSLFTRALHVTDGNYAAYNNLGLVYAGKGRVAKAIGYYRDALRIKNDFAKAHNNLAVALIRQGRMAEAIRHYDRALRINPRFARAHYNLGLTLRKQGKTAQAVDHFVTALKINPNLAVAYYQLGNILAERGRFSAAAERYQMALKSNPIFVQAHHHLGNALLVQGRITEAVDHYLKALRIKPRDAEVHNNLGIALIQRGNLENGIDHLREALRIQPDDAETRHNLEKALARQRKMDQ